MVVRPKENSLTNIVLPDRLRDKSLKGPVIQLKSVRKILKILIN